MKEVYYTVPNGVGKKKFWSLAEAEDFCEMLVGRKHVIMSYVSDDDILYRVSRRENTADDIRKLSQKVLLKLYSVKLSDYYISAVNITDDIGNKVRRLGWSTGLWVQYMDVDYVTYCRLAQDYLREIEVNVLKTDYSPCNGIQIIFSGCLRFIRSGFCYPDSERDLFPDNRCIQLRGNFRTLMSISIGEWDGNHGTNVKDRRREFVDLKSRKVQRYVDRVLGLLDIHYEKHECDEYFG